MQTCFTLLPPNEIGGRPIVGSIELKAHERVVRRKRLTLDSGIDVMVDLSLATPLVAGCGLLLDTGDVGLVRAAVEPLMEAKPQGDLSLAALCWHIGNRHLPCQVEDERVLLERDHVILHMLEGLGAKVTHVEEPFSPLHGAYHEHGGHNHRERHAHEHSHHHEHQHDHGHHHHHD